MQKLIGEGTVEPDLIHQRTAFGRRQVLDEEIHMRLEGELIPHADQGLQRRRRRGRGRAFVGAAAQAGWGAMWAHGLSSFVVAMVSAISHSSASVSLSSKTAAARTKRMARVLGSWVARYSASVT